MNELQAIEIDIQEHLQAEEKHLLARCKLIARIHNEGLWAMGGYKSFRLYMRERWGIEKSEAHDIVKIGTTLDPSVFADYQHNILISHLKILASIDPSVQRETIQLLGLLPTDLVTAKNIELLSDKVQEWMDTDNAFEVFEGGQFKPGAIELIEPAILLELVEKGKRQLEYQSGKRQAPTASFSGYSLNECLQNPLFLNLPSLAPSSIEIYDRGESMRVVISIMKTGEKV